MSAGWKEFTVDEIKKLLRTAINLRGIKAYVFDDDEFLGYPCEENGEFYLVSQDGMKKVLDLSKYTHFDCIEYDNWRGDQINLWTQEEWEKEEQYMNPDSLSFCIGGDDVIDVVNCDFITVKRMEEFGESLSQNLVTVWPFGSLSRAAVELVLKALDFYSNEVKSDDPDEERDAYNAELLKRLMEERLKKSLAKIEK